MTRLLPLLLLLVIVHASTAVAQGGSGNLVAFRDPTSLQIVADGASKAVRFPVAYVEKAKPESIKLVVENIVRDGVQDSVYHGLFDVKWDATGPAVTVDVSLNAALRPGTYQISVRLDGIVDAQNTTQTQQLIVTVPAGAVRSLGTLAIEQMVWFPGRAVINGTALRLQETSRVSRLTEIAVRQLNVDAANGVSDGAKLVYASVPGSIAPGAIADLDGKLEGSFPLGKTTGKLEVSATQLSQPYELTFEVNTAVTKLALVVAIIIGIVIGYVVKTRATLAMALSEAKLQAADVLQHLQNPDYRDSKFRKMLEAALKDLEAAIVGDDPEAISNAQAAGDTAIAAAIADLNTRRTNAQAALLQFEASVSFRWSLSSEMQATLRSAAVACSEAQEFLDKGDVQAAASRIGKSERDTLDALNDKVEAWISRMRELFSDYPDNRPPLSVSLGDSKSELQQFKDELMSLVSDQVAGDFNLLLETVSGYRRRLYRFLEGQVIEVA